MKIIIDTREQTPLLFESFKDVEIERGTLKTGDYALFGAENKICIERKSTSDFLGSITQGRARFERELERMQAFEFRYVLIEQSIEAILLHAVIHTRIYPNSIIGTMVAWEARWGVHFWALPDRKTMEQFIYRIFLNYIKNEKKKESKYDF